MSGSAIEDAVQMTASEPGNALHDAANLTHKRSTVDHTIFEQ